MSFFFEKILKQESYFKIFLKGTFMGFADMLPGISGSTIALMLGIYERFLNSIKNIKFKLLFRFRIKEFFSEEVKFLSSLFCGMIFSFIFFSKILNFFLSNEFARTLLFSFFLGIILSSSIFLLREIKFNFYRIVLFVLGGIISFVFTYFSNINISINLPLKLILCGNLAIFAMLLPGISGSFVLLLLGIYPFIINALSNISDLENVRILFYLSLGIVIGFFIYPRFILFLLNKFYFPVLSFLVGLMLGSVYGLWPFWIYKKMIFKNKVFLICEKFHLPAIFSFRFFLSFIFILVGFILFFKIKHKAKKSLKNE